MGINATNFGKLLIQKKIGFGTVPKPPISFQSIKLTENVSNDRYSFDHFGASVSIDNEYAVVGIPNQDYDFQGQNILTDAGAAYIYKRNKYGWEFIQKISAPSESREINDKFGSSVAIVGNNIIVGAPYHSNKTGIVYVWALQNKTWVYKQTIIPNELYGLNEFDVFGLSITLGTDIMIIGAPNHSYDNNGNNFVENAGATWVFYKNANGIWEQSQKIIAPGGYRNTNDHFGISLASENNSLFIGAPNQDYDSNGSNYLENAGAIYEFEYSNGWIFKNKIVPNIRISNSYFGSHLSLSGEILAVSSMPSSNNGSVYIFRKDVSGNWNQEKIITSPTLDLPDTNGNKFGNSIKLDSNQLVIAAPYQTINKNSIDYQNAGMVIIYSYTTEWILDQILLNPDDIIENKFFGSSIDIKENILLVGSPYDNTDQDQLQTLPNAGSVWVYEKDSSWNFKQKLSAWGQDRNSYDHLGESIAYNNNVLVVGAPNHSYDNNGNNFVENAGAVYVWRFNTQWEFEQKITADGINARNSGDKFGSKVDIFNNMIVISSPYHAYNNIGTTPIENAGAVWVYKWNTQKWEFEQKITADGINARNSGDKFGHDIKIYDNVIVISAPNHGFDSNGENFLTNAGAIWVYEYNTSWSQVKKLTGFGNNGRNENDQFGYSIALYDNMIIAGAPNQSYDENGLNVLSESGAAYVFIKNTTWENLQKLSGRNEIRSSNDLYGFAIASNVDTLAISSPGYSYDQNAANLIQNSGLVYICMYSNNKWLLKQKIVAPTRHINEYFGKSLAITDNWLIVGVPNYSQTSNNEGTVYIYFNNAGIWEYHSQLIPNDITQDSQFGYKVKVNGSTLLISAPYHNKNYDNTITKSNAGAVYIYSLNSNIWELEQKITPENDDWNENDNFGFSISLENDFIIVGSPNHSYDENNDNYLENAGASFLFTKVTDSWILNKKILPFGIIREPYDEYGFSIGFENNILVIGSPGHSYDSNDINYLSDSGMIYVYSYNNSQFTQIQRITSPYRNENDRFGEIILLKNNDLFVGNPNHGYDNVNSNFLSNSGSVWWYSLIDNTFILQQKIVSTSRHSNDKFGFSLDYDNNILVIGSPGDQVDASDENPLVDAGSISVFTKNINEFVFSTKIIPTGTNNRNINDQFGFSVGIENNIIVVGAPYHSYGLNGEIVNMTGAAFVFETNDYISWTLKTKLNGNTDFRNENENFGTSISIDKDVLFVGVPGNNNQDINNSGVVTSYVTNETFKSLSKYHYLNFTGSNYAALTNIDSILNASEFITISLWFNPNNISSNQKYTLLSMNKMDTYNYVSIFLNDNNTISLGYDLALSGTPSIITDTTIVSEWNNIIVQVNNFSNIKIFLNGVEILNQNIAIDSNDIKWFVGSARTNVYNDGFNGKLSDIAVWARLLTNNEIIDINNNTSPELMIDSILGYWVKN